MSDKTFDEVASVASVPSLWWARSVGFWNAVEVLEAHRKAHEDRESAKLEKLLKVRPDWRDIPLEKLPNPFTFCEAPDLLAGYCFELALKAIWFCRHPDEVAVPEEWKGIRGHKLLDLNDKLGLPWKDKERTQLQYLTETIIWFGRYPTTFKLPKLLGTINWSLIEQMHASLVAHYTGEFEKYKDAIRSQGIPAMLRKFTSVP